MTQLTLVPEDEMTPELDRTIRELLCACFPPDVAFFSVARAWHNSAPAYSVIERREERIVGHVGVVVREIAVGGEPAVVAGIQNLAVAPDQRGAGVGPRLMTAAMTEAQRRGIPFGLLFCIPELERYYGHLGWTRLDITATMLDPEHGEVPIPGKNIAMVLPLAQQTWPVGNIFLQGMDW